jgi:hypothetical protein
VNLRQQALVVRHHAAQKCQSLAEAWVFGDHIPAAGKLMEMSSEVVQCAPFPFPHVCPFRVSEDLLVFQQQGFDDDNDPY